MINDPLLIFVALLVVLLLAFLIWYAVKGAKKHNSDSARSLWVDEKVSMSKTHVEENVESSVNGPNVAVTYAMTINLSNWVYSKDLVLPGTYREIFTHGNGHFHNLELNDISSIAIEPFRNDIHIDINTYLPLELRSAAARCSPQTDGSENLVDDQQRTTERVTLKYVPIAEDFHIAIILTHNRVDAYLNGKLNVTKLLKGRILAGKTDTLPLKFFQGAPIKGHISNFRYYNKDFGIKQINELYMLSKMPKQANDLVNSDVDIQSLYNINGVCQ